MKTKLEYGKNIISVLPHSRRILIQESLVMHSIGLDKTKFC